MVRSDHNPLTLFSFALREQDWVLADLLVGAITNECPAKEELARTLRTVQRPGTPRTLDRLHRWAKLTRNLELDPGPD